MPYNDPSIKRGCVTWHSHPATGPGALADPPAGGVPVARQTSRAFAVSL